MNIRLRLHTLAVVVASSVLLVPALTMTSASAASADQVPAAPTTLRVSATDAHTYSIAWVDQATNETGYEISNGVVSRTTGGLAGQGFTGVYDWGGFSPQNWMCVHVRAFNSAGYSAWYPTSSYVCNFTGPALQLPWPKGQQHYIWSGAYGYNCGDHKNRDYFAIDFQLSTGDPVAAVAAGLAHVGYWKDGYGNFVWIEHDGGTTNNDPGVISIYGHLSRLAVSEGQSVSQGQTIGYAGSSGNSTGPHLHFSMRTWAQNWSLSDWAGGSAYKPDPMSGYTWFDAYGQCAGGLQSPMLTAK